MTPKLATVALAAAISALVVSSASATTILEKALDNSSFGWNSNVNGTNQQSTDNVELAGDATVTSISWYGFGNGTDTANFSSFVVRFFQDIVEDTVTNFFYEDFVTAAGVDTGIDQAGNDVFFYTADIADISLLAGTRYDLMIASTDASIWTWSFSDQENDDQFHRNGDGDTWREIGALGNASHAFTLTSRQPAAVPLPAGMPLLLIGLGAFGIAARRNRR